MWTTCPPATWKGLKGSITWFGEDFAYDITDEEACWELLQRPITVLDVSEKELVYPRVSPQWRKGGQRVDGRQHQRIACRRPRAG